MHFNFMSARPLAILIFKSLAIIAMCLPESSYAQSGSKTAGSIHKSTASQTQGSTKVEVEIQPEMEGYCPVCTIEMKKWVKGDTQFTSTFDGQLYLFPGEEQKKMFDAEPVKYVPVLGGDCIVAFKKMGERVPGDIRQAAIHEDRLFLFSNEMAREEFLKDKDVYANADIALDGRCTVCKVEMDKDVDGNPEIAVLYQGLRYFFPNDEQRQMFIADPS